MKYLFLTLLVGLVSIAHGEEMDSGQILYERRTVSFTEIHQSLGETRESLIQMELKDIEDALQGQNAFDDKFISVNCPETLTERIANGCTTLRFKKTKEQFAEELYATGEFAMVDCDYNDLDGFYYAIKCNVVKRSSSNNSGACHEIYKQMALHEDNNDVQTVLSTLLVNLKCRLDH